MENMGKKIDDLDMMSKVGPVVLLTIFSLSSSCGKTFLRLKKCFNFFKRAYSNEILYFEK
jgi:hypothetical protein